MTASTIVYVVKRGQLYVAFDDRGVLLTNRPYCSRWPNRSDAERVAAAEHGSVVRLRVTAIPPEQAAERRRSRAVLAAIDDT